MPLVNGYSDFIPPDFTEHVLTIAPFLSRDAFKLLEPAVSGTPSFTCTA
jgi:hypothetical protein